MFVEVESKDESSSSSSRAQAPGLEAYSGAGGHSSSSRSLQAFWRVCAWFMRWTSVLEKVLRKGLRKWACVTRKLASAA